MRIAQALTSHDDSTLNPLISLTAWPANVTANPQKWPVCMASDGRLRWGAGKLSRFM